MHEMGLIGLAFHPEYKENGFFYVYYVTERDGNYFSRISRFSVSLDNPNFADPATEVNLMDFQQPDFNHNGGQIAFGPDGYLYIALGDGRDPGDPMNAGQDLRSIFGKVLRIDVDNRDEELNYSIPETNPFANNSEYRGEIYAWGFRNPWRMSFDHPYRKTLVRRCRAIQVGGSQPHRKRWKLWLACYGRLPLLQSIH